VKKVDYIVVGLGIAGVCICEQLDRNGKEFVVFDSASNGATSVSGGVFNPVILKRFTMSWNAKAHLGASTLFYKSLSKKLGVAVENELTILRILTSVEEQNDWAVASDRNELSAYLSSEVIPNNNKQVIAPFGFGKVRRTGRIHPSVLLKSYRAYLQKQHKLVSEAFNYSELTSEGSEIKYGGFSASKIIFAEGIAVSNNPFFPKQCIIPNKGEYLIVSAPQLKFDQLLKGPVYIIPLGNDLYKVGATYDRNDQSFSTTAHARKVIIRKLRKMIACDFEVVDQEAGIRPTTRDRRPLMGSLPGQPNFIFFNGLGTHGILDAPFLSGILYDFLENGSEIPKEMNIQRMST
jgi:glycine/D-amino acid oxidase-like deaminating enzyme